LIAKEDGPHAFKRGLSELMCLHWPGLKLQRTVMKAGLLLVALVASMSAVTSGVTSALAQSAPPTVGDRPLLQVQPKGSKAKPASSSPLAGKLRACLEIEDESKERLDCYDAVIPPKPAAAKRKAATPKAVTECRALKEQDERLSCFNGFVEKLPKT
jgi:hypothetical protein